MRNRLYNIINDVVKDVLFENRIQQMIRENVINILSEEQDITQPRKKRPRIKDDVNARVFNKKQWRNYTKQSEKDPNSTAIKRTSRGEISPVAVSKNKKSKSRIVLLRFVRGEFEQPKVQYGNQDRLMSNFHNIIKTHESIGYKVYNGTDRMSGKTVRYLICQRDGIIKELYLETNDLTDVNKEFDIFPAVEIIEKSGLSTTRYGIKRYMRNRQREIDSMAQKNQQSTYDMSQIKPMDKFTPYKKPKSKDGVNTNWDWIENGTPRPFLDMKNKTD